MVCAHGGDTTHAPPNTVSAFRASLAAGADCVEVDAALSRDGVLVVMHVRELAQLLGKKGVQVGDMHSSDLLALRWPSGEAVMSVEEAVRLTSPFVSCVTLDVKTYNDKSGQPLDELAIAEALVGLVAATRCTNCLIWAKSDRVVRRVLELSPGQRTGYIVMNETEESRQLGMHHPLRFNPGAAGAANTLPVSTYPPAPFPSPRRTSRQLQQQQQQQAQLWYPRPQQPGPQEPSGFGGPRALYGEDLSGVTRRRPPRHRHSLQQDEEQLPLPSWVYSEEVPGGETEEEDGAGLELEEAPKPSVLLRQPHPREAMQPGVVGVHFAMVEPELLETLHGAGKQLFAWTINQADVLRAVLDVGVDALVTNYPLTALAAIDARLAKCGALGDRRGPVDSNGREGPGRGGRAAGPTGDYL